MGESRSISLISRKESIPIIMKLIDEIMEAMSFSPEDILRFDLAVEEACANVILHAYGEGVGSLMVTVRAFEDHLEVTLEDEGSPFDPVKHISKSDIPRSANSGSMPYPVGRWGIPLIRALSDEIIYQRRDDKNILQLIKNRANR